MAPIMRRTKSAKSSTKSENFGELDSARIKLNDALDHIWKGENTNDDDMDADDQMDTSPQHKIKRTRGPRKSDSFSFSSKKRMREDGYTKTSSFVVKLFDRSIDLAQFSQNSNNEDSSLYPVCRAWIRNQSHAYFDESHDTMENNYANEDSENEKPVGIYNLPAPLPPHKTEQRNSQDLRILKISKERLSTSEIDELIDSDKSDLMFDSLLQQNLVHWKQVRQQWKRLIQENESRYKHSCSVLKSMYERSIYADRDTEQLKNVE
ncbi:Protein lin-37-like protein [Leptotrombidium deliense]|uniref:Protein lin-37-like protein n=1 Tax=Leptotrombidium deliense TaxID=299467 RepID=A0A443SHE3_9ACAR|nr:Protein lin-37-like protein [Leptotrombidium deliense]